MEQASPCPGIASGYTHAMAKVMISLPDEVLDRIDGEVRSRGTSRSEFLRTAALRELGHVDTATFDAALARSRALFAGAGAFESAKLVRDERDA